MRSDALLSLAFASLASAQHFPANPFKPGGGNAGGSAGCTATTTVTATNYQTVTATDYQTVTSTTTATTTVTSSGVNPASAQAASSLCAGAGMPTPYFDSNGNGVFCGPVTWGGGPLASGVTICPN